MTPEKQKLCGCTHIKFGTGATDLGSLQSGQGLPLGKEGE